jgi:hypothetical protein
MKHITCIEDLRELHKRRVPKAFFDYADRGSYTEDTLRANSEDLRQIKFRQRILVDVSKRDLSTTILGEPAAMPLILAPVGLLGMQHGDGEIHACRAAQAAGIPFTQSTMSICSIEDIAAAVDKPFWFQLYVMKDRGFIKALVERAIAAKCSALVLTVDLQVIGQRHQDIKNGMSVPPEWSLSSGASVRLPFVSPLCASKSNHRAAPQFHAVAVDPLSTYGRRQDGSPHALPVHSSPGFYSGEVYLSEIPGHKARQCVCAQHQSPGRSDAPNPYAYR